VRDRFDVLVVGGATAGCTTAAIAERVAELVAVC
jgi:flavin-dependent dehydrogenase